jgi:predicted component of type VI protein secretion system
MKIIGGLAGLMFLAAVATGCSATKNTTKVQTQPTPIVESSAEPIQNEAAASEEEPAQIQVDQPALETEKKHSGCGGGY